MPALKEMLKIGLDIKKYSDSWKDLWLVNQDAKTANDESPTSAYFFDQRRYTAEYYQSNTLQIF